MDLLKLKPCPCGDTPGRLYICESGSSSWAYATGDCCGEWNIEFRTSYNDLASPECMDYAIEEWNKAPRGDTK